jgi:hypothetical protein
MKYSEVTWTLSSVCSQPYRTHQPGADPEPQSAEDKQHPPYDVSSYKDCLLRERNFCVLHEDSYHADVTIPLLDVYSYDKGIGVTGGKMWLRHCKEVIVFHAGTCKYWREGGVSDHIRILKHPKFKIFFVNIFYTCITTYGEVMTLTVLQMSCYKQEPQ